MYLFGEDVNIASFFFTLVLCLPLTFIIFQGMSITRTASVIEKVTQHKDTLDAYWIGLSIAYNPFDM